MREIETKFADLCTWYIYNYNRGRQVIDSEKRYAFVCKALSCVIEIQGMMLEEMQRLNRRTTDGYARIPMPGGRSIRGEVSRDG